MSARARAWLIGSSALAVVLVLWSLLPWEWSLVDDPGFVLSVRSAVDEHGAVLGPIVHVWRMVETDLSWGLFRPAYWIYPSLVYVLPIGAAHALRLLMLAVAIAGPAVAVGRRGGRWSLVIVTALIVLSASTALATGLFYVSLQELSGAAFVGLGLMARRRGWRLALWVVAAWFKSPFAWVLIGEAVALWRRGERRAAATSAGLGLATLGAGVIFARSGSYTSGYAEDLLDRAVSNIPGLLSAGVVLPIVAVAWWAILTRTGLQWTPLSTTFAIAAGGYAVTVLPWSTAGYYPGPVFYLAAVLAGSLLVAPVAVSDRRTNVALVGPAMAAGIAVATAMIPGFGMNATLLGLARCSVAASGSTTALSPDFGPEQVVRLQQNVELRSPEWKGEFVVPPDGAESMLAASANVLVVPKPVDAALTPVTEVVCDLPYAQVLRVVAD